MCIIAAKPVGVKMPDKETITRMWYRNDDGAGIMYAKDGKVRIDKGFMKLEELMNHLDKLEKSMDLTKTAVVMHFRITTHGGTCPENCHPFPITRSIQRLKTLHQAAPMGIAHNGIIPNNPRKGISDTMEYIISQLAPIYDMNHSFYKNKYALEIIENAISSKMAFLTGAGEIILVGHFEEDNGIKYSNTSYMPYMYSDKFFSGPYGTWSMWEDETKTDTPFDTKYYKYEIPLMWASCLPQGSYYTVDSDNEPMDDIDDLLIDEEGRVYSYDWNELLAYPAPEFTLHEPEGFAARFDEQLAMLEDVGDTYEDMEERWRLAAEAKSKKRNRKAKKGKGQTVTPTGSRS